MFAFIRIYETERASPKLSGIYVRFPLRIMLCMKICEGERRCFKVDAGHEKHLCQFRACKGSFSKRTWS